MSANQDEIHELSLSRDVEDRLKAADLFLDNFESLNDKFNVWFDLIRLTGDEDSNISFKASSAFAYVVPYFPDKLYAWNDLIKLTSIRDFDVIYNVSSALESIFPSLSNKSDALFDLIKLTDSKDSIVRDRITSTIGSIFYSIPNQLRNETFEAIHKLIEDDDPFVRFSASYALAVSFEYLPDELKVQAWNDLCVLVDDPISHNRWCASDALSFSFQSVPDEYKLQAWAIVQELLNDNDENIRQGASSYISYIFKAAPEESKYEVWKEMCQLRQDENSEIVTNAAYELSHVFPFIPDDLKSKTETYLHELSKNINSNVRVSADHSIGKICIYKASKSENENDLKYFLGEAIRYFEIAANEDTIYNPAKFCHLFYRSFDAVIFRKTVSKKDIDVYIEGAKNEIKGSENRQKLLEAVEQLAEALDTAQSAKKVGIERQELLNRCSEICNYADRLMDDSKDKAQFFYTIYKKSRPFFDEHIKEIIRYISEAKEKSKEACREIKDTAAQQAICEINREVQDLTIGSQEYMKKQVQALYRNLKSSVPNRDEYRLVHQEIDLILNEDDLVNQYSSLNMLLPKIIQINVVEATTSVSDEIRLLRETVNKLTESVDDLQNPQEWIDIILQNLSEIKDDIPEMKKNIDDVLCSLYSPMGIDQKLKVALPIIPMLVSYEIEANIPKFAADRISELRKLLTKHTN